MSHCRESVTLTDISLGFGPTVITTQFFNKLKLCFYMALAIVINECGLR